MLQLMQMSAREEGHASRILAHVRESCLSTYQLLGGVRTIQEGNNIESHNMTIILSPIEHLYL